MKRKLLFAMPLLGIAFLLVVVPGSCKKDDFTPELELGVESLTIGPLANSSGAFEIISNTEWTVASSQDWLAVNPASGSENATVSVTADHNRDTTDRTAEITITAKGLSPQILTVTQSGSEYNLSISVSTIEIDFKANSTASFDIVSDTTWAITNTTSWLTVDPSSGAKDATITLTAALNPDAEPRKAGLTITAEGAKTQNVEVTQLGYVYSLSISKTSFSIASEVSSTDTFTVYSDAEWVITNPDSWLTVSPTSGTGNEIVTVTANDARAVGTSRTVRLEVSSNHTPTRYLRVTQFGIPCGPDDEIPCELGMYSIPEMLPFESLPSNPYLPDPFKFMDGSRMNSSMEWAARRAEIAVQAQEYQYGYKPCTPYSATTATLSGTSIIVTVNDNGKEISFTCNITYPNSGSAPYPAMITFGGFSSINTSLAELGVAVISFPNDDIAEQTNTGSRGKGKFYDLFCSDHSAGAIIAWSWGVSRLIDALEKAPEANIDPTKLGVTGCSRNGKGALAAGAFDERIALTIPQESGSGGAANWRVSDYQGSSVQRLTQIVTENCWFGLSLNQFTNSANKLPYDHHMIAALCAPRGLLIIENTDMVWLGDLSTWTTGNAAHKVWEALGVPSSMGFSQIGHGSHCQLPAIQRPIVDAYVKKFLLGDDSVDTNVMSTDGNLEFDEDRWINWTVPMLY